MCLAPEPAFRRILEEIRGAWLTALALWSPTARAPIKGRHGRKAKPALIVYYGAH
jgi:hypothetical protein